MVEVVAGRLDPNAVARRLGLTDREARGVLRRALKRAVVSPGGDSLLSRVDRRLGPELGLRKAVLRRRLRGGLRGEHASVFAGLNDVPSSALKGTPRWGGRGTDPVLGGRTFGGKAFVMRVGGRKRVFRRERGRVVEARVPIVGSGRPVVVREMGETPAALERVLRVEAQRVLRNPNRRVR